MAEVDGGPWESRSLKDAREVEVARITDRTFHINPPSGRDEVRSFSHYNI